MMEDYTFVPMIEASLLDQSEEGIESLEQKGIIIGERVGQHI